MDYTKFIEEKTKMDLQTGFNLTSDLINPALFGFQNFCVTRALSIGRFALFEDCGLGKTIQQLEFAWQCHRHTGKPSLILAPLGVLYQTIEEGNRFGYKVSRAIDGFSNVGIYIINYERLDEINPGYYGCVAFDRDWETLYPNLFPSSID